MTTNLNDNKVIQDLQKKNAELEAQLKEMKSNQSWDYENAHADDWKAIKEMGEL